MLVHFWQSRYLKSNFKKWLNRRMMFCHFLLFLKRLVLCTWYSRSTCCENFCQSLLNEKANKIYSRLDIDTCRSYDSVKTEILRGFRPSSKAYLQKFRTMKRFGEDSYSQFLHKLKDVQNYYWRANKLLNFSRFATTLLEQFRRVLPGKVGVFVDQRNVSSAMEMVKLSDLFYESN